MANFGLFYNREVPQIIDYHFQRSVLYILRHFLGNRYMYQDRDFNKFIEDSTVKKTDRQRLWLYLATFPCQTINKVQGSI